MKEDPILRSLVDIVGQDYASDRQEEIYIYSEMQPSGKKER